MNEMYSELQTLSDSLTGLWSWLPPEITMIINAVLILFITWSVISLAIKLIQTFI